VSARSAGRILAPCARAQAGTSSMLLPAPPGAPCLAFPWGQALPRGSGASLPSRSSSLPAGSLTVRRAGVPGFRSGFGAAGLPPPCPPWALLRAPPGEPAETYSALGCQRRRGQGGLCARSVHCRGPPLPRTRRRSPRIRPGVVTAPARPVPAPLLHRISLCGATSSAGSAPALSFGFLAAQCGRRLPADPPSR